MVVTPSLYKAWKHPTCICNLGSPWELGHHQVVEKVTVVLQNKMLTDVGNFVRKKHVGALAVTPHF